MPAKGGSAYGGQKILIRHKDFWKEKEFFYPVIIGIIFFVASLILNHFASVYTDRSAGNYVHDILLDNLPVMDVDGILNYGTIVFSLIIIFFALAHPKRISFMLKSLALFIFIRSIFISLTHLGPSPIQTPSDLLASLLTGNDFFFSAHTGMPFLLALIFWENKFIRYISLSVSVIFGASVILGHLHYSIDVFAAFFITFTIFSIAKKIFSADYKIFNDASLS